MICLVLLLTIASSNPAFQNVHKLFVSGNNAAAQGSRETLTKQVDYWKKKGQESCFSLVSRVEDADAMLDVAWDSRDSVASGNLTTRASGELLWSDTYQIGDGREAGKLLLAKLARKSGCKHWHV